MNEKQKKLIELLFKHKDWMTASTLSAAMGVSVRTIKNYVADINRLHPDLIVSSTNGYKIREHIARALFDNHAALPDSIPQTNSSRVTYVVIELLRASAPINLYDLCDELFISMSTLRIVLKRVKRQFSQYNLELCISDNNMLIKGLEQNRRQMLRSIIYKETNSASFDLASIQNIFSNIDAEFAVDTLNELLLQYHFYVTDYSIYNIILHVIIAVDRNMNREDTGDAPGTDVAIPEFLPAAIWDMAKELASILANYYGISFSGEDVLEFALLFYTRANSLPNMESMTVENLEDYVGPDCLELIQEIFRYLTEQYSIEFTQPKTLLSFALHIKNLVIRAKNKQFNRNPITESIKTSCPMIYDVAVNISSIIASYTGAPLIDDEITYIAFHIGNALEVQIACNSRISVVLNCPTYYNMNHDLHDRLLERFGNDIIIEDITISEAQLKHYENIDLILSTVPLNIGIQNAHLQIHPFLTMTDVCMIEKSLSRIRTDKRKAYFSNELKKIILPEFFEHLNCTMTKEETLHYMCRRLQNADYATDGFEAAIFEREKLSSTIFTNFAIPHTINMQEYKSCMYILINDQPITWDTGAVNLVIMLCFNAIDRPVFYNIFEPLSTYLLKQSVIGQIVSSHSYDEFIQIISDIE